MQPIATAKLKWAFPVQPAAKPKQAFPNDQLTSSHDWHGDWLNIHFNNCSNIYAVERFSIVALLDVLHIVYSPGQYNYYILTKAYLYS